MVVTVVGMVVFGVVNTVSHNQNQKLLEKDLEETGVALDALVSELKKELHDIELKRTSDCYRASRKYSEGPIYCAQGIEISKNNLTDSQVTDSFTGIGLVLTSFEELKFEKRLTGSVLTEYVASTGHKRGGCSAILSREFDLTGYEFKLECLSGDFDEFIYPERQ